MGVFMLHLQYSHVCFSHIKDYGLESLWGQEVKQVEELLQVVLKRSASQQELVLQWVVVQHSEELTADKK